jgi:hypothetical protein
MNTIDHFLTRLPFNSVTIKTNLDSYSVISRIELAERMKLRRRNENRYFTFETDYEGNYFTIQARTCKEDGSDEFKPTGTLTILGIGIPIPIEQSPILYGRVFDNEGGQRSTIRCHFGLPIPIYLASLSLMMVLLTFIYPNWVEFTMTVFSLCFIWSIYAFYQFVVERNGIIDFMTRLFNDVISNE